MILDASDFLTALPELFLLGMACLVLLIDLFLTEHSRAVTYLLSQVALVGAAVLTLGMMESQAGMAFNGMFIRDGMSDLLKAFAYLSVFVVFLYARPYLRDRGLLKGEFYLLGLFATLGMMVLISAASLLTVYLGLELLSLSLYAMVAMNRQSPMASEAAMKYFVLGAMASGMLLYGMSMIYGATGELELAAINAAIGAGQAEGLILTFGLVFLVVGVAFKLGAVPFHMWIPDVYHGAPTPMTVFIATAPKLAAFAMAIRLMVDGLGELHAEWQGMFAILAVLSMGVGNLLAIAQSNIKRMLAYSAIAHVGFILLGVLTATESGYAAAMFYTIAYSLMTLAGFGMVILLSRAGLEAERLEDFKGLNERSPWFAGIMLIVMFSMAGVPPFLGFWAKVGVIQEVVAAGMVELAVAAVVFSIIGAFYYLRVVKFLYFDKPEDTGPLVADADLRAVLSVNGLAILGLGLFPGALMSACIAAFGLPGA
ncbi:NADH-quinone oxidoreductase subunit NuoN [Thiohalospira sp.]|uniref:NADH-quinone oxidoreductase subunit NuoN n=1 Tax=Thiohalospira sp. TaxID=3080549 RepID=UPI00397EA879